MVGRSSDTGLLVGLLGVIVVCVFVLVKYCVE